MTSARKRKVQQDEAISPPTSKVAKSATPSKSKSAEPKAKVKASPEVVGGLNGDYRIDGTETSSAFATFTIPSENDKVIPCQFHGKAPTKSKSNSAAGPSTLLIFTHGAGGGLENPATQLFAQGYGSDSNPVLCFQGTMNLQNRAKSFQTVFEYCKENYADCRIAVGGRSMGARAAVLLAQKQESVKKLVLVSYPLTSPKGEIRDQILLDLPGDKEVMFLSGDRDSMCEITQLNKLRAKMVANSVIVSVKDADHGMSLVGSIKNKARAVEQIRKKGGEFSARWVCREDSSARESMELCWNRTEENAILSIDEEGEEKAGADDGVDTANDYKEEAYHTQPEGRSSPAPKGKKKKEIKVDEGGSPPAPKKDSPKNSEAQNHPKRVRRKDEDTSTLRRSSRRQK